MNAPSLYTTKYLAIKLIVLLISYNQLVAQREKEPTATPESIPDLVCFWDFQPTTKGDLTSRGAYNYTLTEMNGPIVRNEEGIFGPASLEIEREQWLRIKHQDCPGLDRHGQQEVTIVAWVKRKTDVVWQYIAGMWNERDAKRQYALITCGHKQSDYRTLNRTDAQYQPHGYVSDVGGATPGHPFCFSYATGAHQIPEDEWAMIAFTYDHEAIRVYFNGELDANGNSNPFYWNKPILDGGENGADFTVAQRAVRTWPDYPEGAPGNKVGFGGTLGGLAVYNRALTEKEMQGLYKATMLSNE